MKAERLMNFKRDFNYKDRKDVIKTLTGTFIKTLNMPSRDGRKYMSLKNRDRIIAFDFKGNPVSEELQGTDEHVYDDDDIYYDNDIISKMIDIFHNRFFDIEDELKLLSPSEQVKLKSIQNDVGKIIEQLMMFQEGNQTTVVNEVLDNVNKVYNFKYIPLFELQQKSIKMIEETGLDPADVSTSKLFNDNMVEDDFDSTFRPITKQAIASLSKKNVHYDKDGNPVITPVINKLLGTTEFVDYDVMLPKIINSLIGAHDIETMMNNLQKESTIIPELQELYTKAINDDNLKAALFSDLNKIRVREKFIDSTGELKIQMATKLGEYYYSNAWAEELKNFIIEDLEGYENNLEIFRSKYRYLITGEFNKINNLGVDKLINDSIKVFNLFNIDFKESELLHYAMDDINATENMITGSPIEGYEEMNVNSKVATTLNLLVDSLNIMNLQISKNLKKIGDVSNLQESFNQYASLNRFAKIKDKYGYGARANKFTYLDVNNNMKNSINKISFMGAFINDIHNLDDTSLLNKFKEYYSDPAMKYSNLLMSLQDEKGNIIRNGFLKIVDKELKLNKDFIKQFDYFIDGGTRNAKTESIAAYKKDNTINWQIAKAIYYTENIGKNNRISIHGLIPGDASNNILFETEKLEISRDRDYDVIDNKPVVVKDSNLYKSLLNTYLQEKTRMDEAAKLLFREHPKNKGTYDYYRDEEGNIDEEYYNNTNFQKDYHYIMRNGKRVFLTLEKQEGLEDDPMINNSIPTGNVFKYQNFTSLNKFRNKYNSKLNLSEEEIVQMMFDELIIDAKLSNDYLKIFENDITKDLERNHKGLLLEMIVNQKLFNIEYQNMFSGVTAEFGSKEIFKNSGEYNVSTKGLRQTVVRAKGTLQAGLTGSYSNPNVNFIVLSDLVKDSLTKKEQLDEIKKQLIKDGFKEGSRIYEEKLQIISDSLSHITTGDGAGYGSVKRWVDVQKANGRWDLFEDMFKPITINDKGHEVYKLRDDLNVAEQKRLTVEVVKPVYYNRQLEEITDKQGNVSKRMVNKYVKYAWYPLFEQFTKYHPDLDALRVHIEENDIQEAIYESAMKQGLTNVNDIVTGESLDKDKLNKAIPIQLQANHFRTQLELSDHSLDSENKLGTQLQKLAIANIMPDDYYYIDDIKGSIKGSEVIDKHFDILDKLIHGDFTKLLNKLDIKVVDGKLGINDFKRLVNLFTNELKRTGMSEDIEKLLQLDGDGKLLKSIDANIVRRKLLSIFTAQFTNNVKFTKFPGSHLTFVPDNFMRATKMQNYESEITDVEKLKNGLKTIKTKDEHGNTIFVAEVLVPAYAREFLNKDGSVDIDKIDPKLLELMGYRIPTTGKHSKVVFKVVGFIPNATGSNIVTSRDFIGKTGWDFDIDSVYMMNLNYMVNKNYDETNPDSYKFIPYKSPDNYDDYVYENVYEKAYLYEKENNALKKITNHIKSLTCDGIGFKTHMHRLHQERKEAVRTIYQRLRNDGLVLRREDWNANIKMYKENQNDLFKLWKGIQLSSHHMIEGYTPAYMGNNIKARDEVNSYNNNYNDEEKAVVNNPTSTIFQDITHPKAVLDKQFLSVFANFNVIATIHQVAKSTMSPVVFNYSPKDLNIETQDDIDRLSSEFDVIFVKGDERHKNLYIKDINDVDYVSITANKIARNNKNFYNVKGDLITQNIGEDFANASVAIKEHLITGINDFTIKTYSYIKVLGQSTEFAALLINQPIIQDIAKANEYNKRFTNDMHAKYNESEAIKGILYEFYNDNHKLLYSRFKSILESGSMDKDFKIALQIQLKLSYAHTRINKIRDENKRELEKATIFKFFNKDEVNFVIDTYKTSNIITTDYLKELLSTKNDSIEYKSKQLGVYNYFNSIHKDAKLLNKYNQLLNLDKKPIGNNFNASRNTFNTIKEIIKESILTSIVKSNPQIRGNKFNILIEIYPKIFELVINDIVDNPNAYNVEPDRVDEIIDYFNDMYDEKGEVVNSTYPLLQSKFIYGDIAAQQVASSFMISEHPIVKTILNDKLGNDFKHIRKNALEILQSKLTDYFITSISMSNMQDLANNRLLDKSLPKFVDDTVNKISKYKRDNENRESFEFVDYIEPVSKLDEYGNKLRVFRFNKGISRIELDEIKYNINKLYFGKDSELKELLLDVLAIGYFRNGVSFDTEGMHNMYTVDILEDLDVFKNIDLMKELLEKQSDIAIIKLHSIYNQFQFSYSSSNLIAPRIYPKEFYNAINNQKDCVKENIIIIDGKKIAKQNKFNGLYFKQVYSYPTTYNTNVKYAYNLFKKTMTIYNEKGELESVEYHLVSKEATKLVNKHYCTPTTVNSEELSFFADNNFFKPTNNYNKTRMFDF